MPGGSRPSALGASTRARVGGVPCGCRASRVSGRARQLCCLVNLGLWVLLPPDLRAPISEKAGSLFVCLFAVCEVPSERPGSLCAALSFKRLFVGRELLCARWQRAALSGGSLLRGVGLLVSPLGGRGRWVAASSLVPAEALAGPAAWGLWAAPRGLLAGLPSWLLLGSDAGWPLPSLLQAPWPVIYGAFLEAACLQSVPKPVLRVTFPPPGAVALKALQTVSICLLQLAVSLLSIFKIKNNSMKFKDNI